MSIQTISALRELYVAPQERALRKELPALDIHCRNFIKLAPFVILATSDLAHNMDASPRGGAPGFVQVTDTGDLLLPDSPGNNRLDSLENIVNTGTVGLLFLIPGFDETLRVNGTAILSLSEHDIAACTTEKRAPKLVIRVGVQAAYLQCAKALMRSQLWAPEALVDRALLPTAGTMLSDHTGIHSAPETREQMVKRYAPDL